MLSTNIRLPPKWIEMNIMKTECATFIAAPNDPTYCQCGSKKMDHGEAVKYIHRPETWSPRTHTKLLNTDAYGTILFEGEHHPNKAHYARLSYDTNPELTIQLMTYVWNLEMPQLLISVRGGSSNFEMSPRLGKIFQTGLIKAARNTNAWIFSTGLNAGVTKHVGNALSNEKWMGSIRRGRLTAVGIASWGMVEKREELIGRNKERTYNPMDNKSKFLHLNSRHSNFLLVDNGTIGKFGGENYLRRRLEKAISSYHISPNRGCRTPVVVIVLEGGFYTLRQISDYLYDEPPIPVVILAGTGRSADLISFVIRKVPTEDDFNNDMKDVILNKIYQYFRVNSHQCSVLYNELRNIYKKKSLITVYNPNSTNEEDFDAAILSSIFRSQHWSPLQQLSLTLVWNRVDIAQTEVFIYGRDWSRDHLELAMMEALVSNRLEFVSLLLEHGINMQTFLTANRLEALYSLDRIPSKALQLLLIEFSQVRRSKEKFREYSDTKQNHQQKLTLHDIGIALTHMIGHVYQSSYIYMVAKDHTSERGIAGEHGIRTQTFLQPFDDLFIWAVLTKRHEMSKLLWRHGKGALAKALIAIKLNRYMANEIAAAEKSSTSNIAMDFQTYANEWENLSVNLLGSCYRSNFKMTRQLLTMELANWSKQTCLHLAVMANHRTLLGHSACQILLADLWMGALNISSNSTLKIILGILFPPLALCYEYKSTEELQLLPHQATVHLFGTPSTAELNPDVHDLAHDTPHAEHSGDPESYIRPRTSVAHVNELSDDERTTDLAIVARNIFPLSADSNKPKVEKINENTRGFNPNSSLSLKVADRGTEMSHEHFRFKSKTNNNQLLENYDKAVVGKKVDRSSFVTTHQSLGLWRKFVEFQTAPITNYIRHTIGYLLFVNVFVYLILFSRDRNFSEWVECYVIAYFVTQFLECAREFINIDANFSEKLVQIRSSVWQCGDFIIVTVCLMAAALRLAGFYEYGMLTYRVCSIYWNARLYKYLGVHRYVGPKISVMSRMVKHMIHFSVIIVVVVIAFGIIEISIRFPNKDPTLKDLVATFLEPFKMMFGEVDDLESLSSYCGQQENEHAECPTGYWIVPIVWVLYMLVSNILLVNVLIAMFNGIYEEVDAMAVEVWMFQRFDYVMEFEQKPLFPPPFIILCHMKLLFICLYENLLSFVCDEELLLLESQFEEDVHPHIIMANDQSLKCFLGPEEQSMVFDFEEENVDNLTPLLESPIALTLTAGIGMGSTPNSLIISNVASSTGTAIGNRMGIGNEKIAVQHMKVVIGELHSELENQKSKLDKLINFWELDMASSNPGDATGGEQKLINANYRARGEGIGQPGLANNENK